MTRAATAARAAFGSQIKCRTADSQTSRVRRLISECAAIRHRHLLSRFARQVVQSPARRGLIRASNGSQILTDAFKHTAPRMLVAAIGGYLRLRRIRISRG